MPRKSTKGRALPAGDPIENFVPFDEQEETLERVISKLGDGEIEIKVDKMEGHGWAYCFSQTGGELSEDFVRDKYGPGRYRVRVFQSDDLKHTAGLNIAGAVNVAALPNVNGMDSNMRLMMEMHQKSLENMIRLFEAQSKNQVQAEAPNAMELLDLMIKAQQLRPSESAGMGADKILDVLKMGMDIAKEHGGKEPETWASIIGSTLREALPMLTAGLQAPPGAQAPKQLTNGQQPSQEDELKAREMMLRQGIQYLKNKSLAGSDPELYTEMALDNLDNPLYRGVLDWVCGNEWEQIVQFDPELGKPPHEQFFRAFYDGLRQAVSSQNPVAPDTGGQGGDIPNAPDNADAGAGRVAKPPGSRKRTQ